MALIFCDEACIYQTDGCCRLECAAAASNRTDNGCIHCISPGELFSGLSEQQQHPLSSSPRQALSQRQAAVQAP